MKSWMLIFWTVIHFVFCISASPLTSNSTALSARPTDKDEDNFEALVMTKLAELGLDIGTFVIISLDGYSTTGLGTRDPQGFRTIKLTVSKPLLAMDLVYWHRYGEWQRPAAFPTPALPIGLPWTWLGRGIGLSEAVNVLLQNNYDGPWTKVQLFKPSPAPRPLRVVQQLYYYFYSATQTVFIGATDRKIYPLDNDPIGEYLNSSVALDGTNATLPLPSSA